MIERIHPGIAGLIAGFRSKELHAAYSGRELMRTLVQIADESDAQTTAALCDEIEQAIDQLLPDMPAYAPPLNVIHIIFSLAEEAISTKEQIDILRSRIEEEGERYLHWSEAARQDIARRAIDLIPGDGCIFTFTLSETVLNTLLEAWRQGKKYQVYVTESRPNNDGLITAQRLDEMGVPVTVSIDACLPEFVSRADLMICGAEAILEDGSAVCKAGTYLAALVSREQGIPVYVLVDTMKFNISERAGFQLDLDHLTEEDVMDIGKNENYKVAGSFFDITPPDLIQGIVTERGLVHPEDCAAAFDQMRLSEKFIRKLQALPRKSVY